MASAVEICLAQEAKLKDTQVKENAVRFNPTTYLFERWTGSAWTPVGSSIDESNLVHKTGNETISGTKTFNDTIVGSVSGNSGASDKATKLATARSINVTDGTNNGTAAIFDGSGDASIKLPSTIKATLDGNAGSATKLATARTIRTNLSSASTASFDGSANVTPGVTGILPVANGGTGNSTGKAPSAVKDGAGNTIADTYIKTVNNKAPSDGNVNIAARNVGDEWFSYTGKIPAGGVPYCGQTVTRATYADLWAYVQDKGLVKTEDEWQALNTSQSGNVPFYSDGDGSSTFRMPKVVGYIKGTASVDGAGSYTAEGLPNITGTQQVDSRYGTDGTNGALSLKYISNYGFNGGSATINSRYLSINASLSNPIYGNSDHVTPETITVLFGVYAYGELTVTGSTTTDALATGLANVEAGLSNKLDNDTVHIVKTWKSSNGASWYRKWSDGWIEQGGIVTSQTNVISIKITFNTAFSNTNYYINTMARVSADYYDANMSHGTISKSTSSCVVTDRSLDGSRSGYNDCHWYACGY